MRPKFHPLAELFPLMDGAEFDALVTDISENGLREPIVLHDEQILDGRNRYRACEQAGVEPKFEQWENGSDPRAYVVSKNLHRRHLSVGQRAMIAARIANAAHGTIGGGHEAESLIRLSDAAGLLNVSRTSVVAARKVLSDGTQEEIKAVEAGEASPQTIAEQIGAKMPAAKRRRKRSEPLNQTGKNPERIQRAQINAEIWGRLRDSLTHLTSLPMAAEVAAISRANDRSGLVDAKLAKSIQWLTEFSDAWNANG